MVPVAAHVRSVRRRTARTVLLAVAPLLILIAWAVPAAAQRPRVVTPATPSDESAPLATSPESRASSAPRPQAGPVPPGIPLPPNFDSAGPLFDGSVLQDVLLTMNPGDWEALKADYLADTYYRADFQWRGVKVPVIGVRSRGAGSRHPSKPSLRIDFNRFLLEQKFLGLGALVLANAVQDPGMMNRRLAMTVFSAMELPAPRIVHARLFVNGEYIGLYELVEAIEKAFLARAFGWDSSGRKRRDDGYLFEYKWESGYDFSYFGFDLPRYAALFEAQTHETEAPTVLYGPIDEMIRTINEASDEDFAKAVGKYLYLAVFIRHLAVERFIAELDGFLGDWGPNNVYFYRFENSTLSAVIPWDKDVTFWNPWYQSANVSGLNDDIYRGFQRSVLGRRILELPALHRAYLESLLDCAVTLSQPDAPGAPVSWLEAEALRQQGQILEAARADSNKPYSNESVDAAHRKLLEFIRRRSAAVEAQVQRALERMDQGVR
jgi:hypothetical protein